MKQDTEHTAHKAQRKTEFVDGSFETVKFAHRRDDYYRGMSEVLEMGYTPMELLHNFPAFVGHMSLWRALTLYELYKKTIGLAGHIADVGVYMGASALLFGKLVQIFERESLTLVHGFDWFQGTDTGAQEDKLLIEGTYVENEQRVRALIKAQKLDHVLKLHRLNIATDLDAFFEKHPSMRFKLVFLDAGTYGVVSNAIRFFWPRLTPGGILVLDQFNNEVAPGETRAVCDLLGDCKVETIPNAWMPSAFIQKPYAVASRV